MGNFTTPDPSGGVDVPYQFVPYSISLLISALATLALAVYGIRQRQSLGTNLLGLCMTIGTLWSCANALEFSAETKSQLCGIVKEALNNIRKHSKAEGRRRRCGF